MRVVHSTQEINTRRFNDRDKARTFCNKVNGIVQLKSINGKQYWIVWF